jgi:hypothetical protein
LVKAVVLAISKAVRDWENGHAVKGPQQLGGFGSANVLERFVEVAEKTGDRFELG